MKYIIIAIVGVIAVFGLCFLVSGLIRRKMKKKIPMILHVLIGIVSGLIKLAHNQRVKEMNTTLSITNK